MKKMNASIAIQVLPKVATDAETVRIVDAVIHYIRSYGVNLEVGPFETTLEGDFDTLMEILKGCPQVCVDAGAPGAMIYTKINFVPDGVMTMAQKCDKHRG